MKNKRGITLISLVVTIVILVVLAGVAINLTVGENGLLRKAKLAKEEYNNAVASEEEQLNELYAYLNGEDLPENTKENPQEAGTPVKIPSSWITKTPKIVDEKGNVKVASTNVTYVAAVADGQGNTIPVPDEFYYVGGNLATGVVISDNPDDKNKYVGYEADGTTVKAVGVDLVGNQFVWIPCTLDGANGTIKYEKKVFEGYSNSGWDNQTNAAEKVQVGKYGGFYIGRYEAGLNESGISNIEFAVSAQTISGFTNWQSDIYLKDKVSASGVPTVKANQIPWFHANYETAMAMSQKLYENKTSVSSGLVTGTMWDTMMKYMQAHGVNVTDNCTWGNFVSKSITGTRGKYCTVDANGNTTAWKDTTSSDKGTDVSNATCIILTTGSTEDVMKMNIYDVAGNLYEWTDEAAYINVYSSYNKWALNILRGGGCAHNNISYPACYRYGDSIYAATTYTHVGFRVALYIK